MSMYQEESDPGESWSPPEDESDGLNTSVPGNQPGQTSPYMNPPEGNPIQSGAQAAESGLANTFGRQGPIPNTGDPDAAPPDLGGGAKRIASYLMGADAMSPQEAEARVNAVKQPGMSDDDANILAIHEAAVSGGHHDAWRMLQYNRMAFNAKQAFALAAANGTDGKPSDLAAAADAATKAGAHVPDGSSVAFHADRLGVTATVLLPGTSQRQTFEMTPQQFAKYLDFSNTSQWDRLIETGGIPVALAKVGATLVGGNQSADKGDAQSGYNPGQAPDSEAVKTGKPIARDAVDADQPAIPGTHDEHGHYLGPKEPNKTNYGDEAEARSTAIFGKGNVGTEPARQQWMNTQEEKELERGVKVDVAKEKGVQDREKAKIMAGGKVDAATVTAEGRKESSANRVAFLRENLARQLKQMELNHGDAQQRNAAHLANARLMSNPGMSTDDIAKLYQQVGVKLPQGDTPTSVAPQQAPAQQSNTGVPPAEKRVLNQVYDTPKGKFKWMGTGWQPVQ